MKTLLPAALLLLFLSRGASAQAPIRIDYTLRVDPADLSGVTVEMHVAGAPASFRLAMEWHPEYDDQYWRYLTGMKVTSTGAGVSFMREDSSVWRVNAPRHDVTISYRIEYPSFPPMQLSAWKAHLGPNGGLVGGPHSFLYVVGSEKTPSRVTLVLPAGWDIATGLQPAGKGVFTAPGAEELIDSPILVGTFRSWEFAIDGVPHRIVYQGQPGGVPFDSTLLVANVEKIARESARLMGWMPYRRFVFQFEDGAQGGLEHGNSITIGVQSAQVARDPNAYLSQIAHEYFHIWNEVHLRPAAWIGIRHVAPAPSGELWWAEGVTLYYADLVMRRAGIRMSDSTRIARLERQIAMYAANPSHGMVSPEHVSRDFNLPPGGNGDYIPSMYTQGEMLGIALDLMIREGSKGLKSLGDVMRTLTHRFDPAHGYVNTDLEAAVRDACGCDAKTFFDRFIRNAAPIDFNRWLGVLGLRSVVTWEQARAADGTPAADLRVSGFQLPGETAPRLQIWFPETVWGKAGLHTGDRLVSWNGRPIADVAGLRAAIGQLHVGDTVRLSVMRDAVKFDASVVVAGYQRPVVHLEDRPDVTAAQKVIRVRWAGGG